MVLNLITLIGLITLLTPLCLITYLINNADENMEAVILIILFIFYTLTYGLLVFSLT